MAYNGPPYNPGMVPATKLTMPQPHPHIQQPHMAVVMQQHAPQYVPVVAATPLQPAVMDASGQYPYNPPQPHPMLLRPPVMQQPAMGVMHPQAHMVATSVVQPPSAGMNPAPMSVPQTSIPPAQQQQLQQQQQQQQQPTLQPIAYSQPAHQSQSTPQAAAGSAAPLQAPGAAAGAAVAGRQPAGQASLTTSQTAGPPPGVTTSASGNAGTASAAPASAPAPAPAGPAPEPVRRASSCAACGAAGSDLSWTECGHMAVCGGCGKRMAEREEACKDCGKVVCRLVKVRGREGWGEEWRAYRLCVVR